MTFVASHLVLKDNFTVVAQPSFTGNSFSWDTRSKGTTVSLPSCCSCKLHSFFKTHYVFLQIHFGISSLL